MNQPPPLARPPGFREPGLPIRKPPPLRKVNLPPSFYKQQKRRSFCCRCCCCLFIFIVLLALFLISFGGLFYLWCKPRVPVFALKYFQVNKLNIIKTPDNPEGHTLNSRVSVSMEFKNPNKNIKLVYDRIAMSWYSEDIVEGLSLGEETVPGFIQERNNVTVVKFSLKGNQQPDDFNAKKLKDQVRAKSLMTTVEVRTGIGMVLSRLKIGTLDIKLICGASTVKDIQDGAMPKCKVFVFRLINIY